VSFLGHARLLVALKLVLLVVFVVSTNHGVGARLLEFANRDNWFAIGVFGLIWGATLIALLVVAFLPALWMRLFWALPIAASASFGDLSYSVSHAHLTFYDVVMYWSEFAHWGEATAAYSSFFVLPVLKGLVGAAALAIPHGRDLPARWLFWAPALPFLLVLGLLLRQGGEGTRALPEQYNVFAMAAAIAIHDPLTVFSAEREPVSLAQSGVPLARHVVLVVDESVRADFLRAEVVPFLSAQGRRLADYGYAVSGNNCSVFSNLILRFGGIRERLPESIRTQPSIWSFAHAAGYTTVYIDGQKPGGQLQNGMTVLEKAEIDVFLQPDHIARQQRDRYIATQLREMLAAEDRQFIYINKKGTHFPYVRNYPPEAALEQPDMAPGESIGESRERMLNSYRNSVRWNVDSFFRELLESDLADTLLVYTSDHGQNLMDRGVMTQCNSSDPHFYEGLVPLRILSGDPVVLERFRRAASANRDRATHFEIFPTLLQALGFDAAEVRARYGPGLLDELADRERRFSYGPVAGFRSREVRWKTMPPDLRKR
jgi:lipid A ethanolaminephosphotransferase